MNNISCITVTRDRINHLSNCINLFIKQSYQDKELIIVYYNTDKSTEKYLKAQHDRLVENNIKYYKFIEDDGMYLGAVRNFAISKAQGEYICVWDDDDFHAPDRLEKQHQFCIDNELIGCTLRCLLIYSHKYRQFKLSFERDSGWEGSLLVKKEFMPRYKNLKSGEDTPVIDKLTINPNFKTLFNPDLYVYIFHDNNISGGRHKEEILGNSFDLNIEKSRELYDKIYWL